MKKSDLADNARCAAVTEMENGLIDADLGGGICKKRVALHGRGKRSGARTIVAFNALGCWIFLYGFAKNQRETMTERELEALRMLGADLMKQSDSALDQLVRQGALQEICHDQNDQEVTPSRER